MSDQLIFKATFTIKAPVEKVWDALINPEMTKQYMFGCVPITDWKIGSQIIWKGEADGVGYVFGKILKFEPNKLLSTTTFNPYDGYPDIPENYLTGEYALSSENNETILNITQWDFSKVPDGEKRYKEAGTAWDMAMGNLKNLLEN